MVSSLPQFLTFLEPILYQPLLNILILFYYYIGDLGIAVILLTILIKILLSPLIISLIRSRKKMADIQPEIRKIKEKYKNDLQKQGMMLIDLFKKSKINPFSGCFPLLLQMPILLILFFLFKDIVGDVDLTPLYYNFVPVPQIISPYFLNLINLAKPNIVLAFIVGISQFLQIKGSLPPTKNNIKQEKTKISSQELIMDIMTRQMAYIFPIMIAGISLVLPSVLALYWIIASLFTAGLQYLYK